MSPRTRVTFAKRQKEQARREKQRAKAQRKLERKIGDQQATQADVPEGDTNQTSPVSNETPVAQMDS